MEYKLSILKNFSSIFITFQNTEGKVLPYRYMKKNVTEEERIKANKMYKITCLLQQLPYIFES